MNAVALFCGLLFGAGACISGMTRPSKVLAFLDFGGAWDPSLLVVMATALAIHVVAWRLVARRPRPWLGGQFPAMQHGIDVRLIGGAALFGVGWGLSGFCPGPAVVSVASGTTASLVFLGTVVLAMIATDAVAQPTQRRAL